MARTKTETQIQWSASDTQSVSSGSNATSDAYTFDATAESASVSMKADNEGTPASGDTITFYALYTNGDTDNTGGPDEYDTAEQGHFLAVVDTNANEPAQKTAQLNVNCKGMKIYAVSGAASNSITVSCRLTEKRSS